MCGLIAVRDFSATSNLEPAVQRALASLARRGPDGEGLATVEQTPRTVLGHRRLAIYDTRTVAAQPMLCPDTGNSLVFNGAIYNFRSLRDELRASGCVFRTDSDTEVLLHGWRVWGEELFARCNGMWALVIWDAASGDLVYCRDRLGIKPLYLCNDGQTAILASEISAIADFRGGYPPPNPEKLFDFLVTSYSEQSHATFFQGIQAVPPGQVYRLSRTGRTRARAYHHWPQPGELEPLDAEALHALLTDAVSLRLRADVPVASLLSGGLDSSIITHLALKASDSPQHRLEGAFTYAYHEAEHAAVDESAKAAAFMHASGRPDLHRIVRFAAIPSADELMSLVGVQGEPFATPSILASFRTYRAIAEQGFKVVLGGEGADELLGGYTVRYHPLAVRSALHQGQWRQAAKLMGHRTFPRSLLLNRMIWDMPLSVITPLLRRLRPSVQAISGDLWSAQRQRMEAIRDNARLDLEQRLRDDQLSSLLPRVLRMADRTSMDAGIELRSPFMDYRLVERALVTPAAERVGERYSKVLLRTAFRNELPASVVETPKNTGFGHAEQFLLRRLPWEPLLEDLPAELGSFIDVASLRRRLSDPHTEHSTLWQALSVALWYRRFYA
ncbi:asparagine synthase (glutamine-hydrolyzing) [Aquipseudomonas alcaligenes]|uniref:asparagine synthase (glutamine-hydrolyzing) n=1 Tax=Aquipseudomonas alcaligenes TaxID=43263 RepID=A0A1N6XKV0_AQUAC|nr:asparagine synthase (glutamine-hydrolyzing) [Pseudomonas alcaligenes]SIR02887.1 asparagine synthase (glutamine-hydrolysing) [Pseudomonas alcaligenes]